MSSSHSTYLSFRSLNINLLLTALLFSESMDFSENMDSSVRSDSASQLCAKSKSHLFYPDYVFPALIL